MNTPEGITVSKVLQAQQMQRMLHSTRDLYDIAILARLPFRIYNLIILQSADVCSPTSLWMLRSAVPLQSMQSCERFEFSVQ